MKKTKDIIYPILGALTFGLSLEFICRALQVPIYLLPPPSHWFLSFFENRELLFKAWLETTANSLVGFGLSLSIGLCLALSLSLSELIRKMFYPLFVLFQTIPIVSIAPLMVIWFGFGTPTVIASSFFVSIFPVLASTMSGLFETKAEWLELFRSYKATRLQTLMLLQVPSAIASFFSGLRIAMGLALIGSIVGEFIAGSGLGSVIDSARSQQRVDLVFAAVLLLTLTGFVLVQTIDLTYWVVQKRRPFNKF